MRITGGVYRGRKVQCPKGLIRPAMDRMRESMFSILGSLEGSSFLDLFSGSGLVGIEAASRGASPVILVEMDRKKRPVIERNIGMVESEIQLVMMPVERFFKRGSDVRHPHRLQPADIQRACLGRGRRRLRLSRPRMGHRYR